MTETLLLLATHISLKTCHKGIVDTCLRDECQSYEHRREGCSAGAQHFMPCVRCHPLFFSLCIKKRFNAKGFSCLGCFLRQCLAVRAERQEAVGQNWGDWTEISSFFFRRVTSYKKAENNNRVSEECWDVPSVIVSNLKHWCQFGRSVRSIV